MKQLVTKQKLPITLKEAWAFFSSPKNLEEITPSDMKFVITNNPPEKMHAGMVITYKVTPLLNIPLSWMTEITQVNEPYFFIDDQRAGPFKIWHHQHHFREIEGGVEMTDIVTYAAPFGFIGRIAEKLIVDKKVKGIFDFRHKLLEEKFGKL